MLNWIVLFFFAFVQDVQLTSKDVVIEFGELYEGIHSVYEISLQSENEVDWSKLSGTTTCSCVQVRKDPLVTLGKSTVVSLSVRPSSPLPISQTIQWKIADSIVGSIAVKGTVIQPLTMDYGSIRAKDVVKGTSKFTITANDGVMLSAVPKREHEGISVTTKLSQDSKVLEINLSSKEEPEETLIVLEIPFSVVKAGRTTKGLTARTIRVVNPGPSRISPSTITIPSGYRNGRFIWRDNRAELREPVKFLLVSPDGKEFEIPIEKKNMKESLAVISFVVPDGLSGVLQIRAVDTLSTVLAEANLVCGE